MTRSRTRNAFALAAWLLAAFACLSFNVVSASASTRSFTVTGGEGSVTFMGMVQPTPVDPGGTITLEATSDSTAILDIGPEIGARAIPMQRQAGNLWTGSFNEWVGLPANVDVRMSFESPTAATLLLDGTSELGAFRILMNLVAIDGEAAPPAPGPGPGDGGNTTNLPDAGGQGPECARLADLEADASQRWSPSQRAILEDILQSRQMAGNQNRSEATCLGALYDLINHPSLQAPQGNPTDQANPTPRPDGSLIADPSAACNRLEEMVLAVQQAFDPFLTGLFNQILGEVGINDYALATAAQCQAMLDSLAREGIDSPERIREIAAQSAQPNQSPTNPVAPVQPNASMGPECLRLQEIELDAANRWSPAERRILDGILAQRGQNGGANRSEATCLAALYDILNNLDLQNVLANQTTSSGDPADPPACQAFRALEDRIKPFSGPEQVQAIRAVGINNGITGLAANRTQANCRAAIDELLTAEALQDALVQAGIISPPGPGNQEPRGSAVASCREIDPIVAAIDAINDPEINMIFNASLDSSGFPSAATATDADCRRLLELLAMEGLGSADEVRRTAAEFARQRGAPPANPTTPSVPPGNPSVLPSFQPSGGPACSALAQAIRPILRGGERGLRGQVLGILQANGITDVSGAPTATCAGIMIELIAASLIPNDGVDWSSQTQPIAPPRPGGVIFDTLGPPILPDPSDFVPLPTSQPVAPSPQPRPQQAVVSGGCLALSDFIVAVLNAGNGRHMFELADVLNSASIVSISGSSDPVCASAQTTAQQRGIRP